MLPLMQVAAHTYEIDPRRFGRNRFHVWFLGIFWLVWTPITLGVTGILALGEGPTGFLVVWLCFGWLGVVLIPWSLLTQNRRQRIEIGGGSLTLTGAGLLPWTRRSIPLDRLGTLTLEHYSKESVLTLNLFTNDRFPRRVMLATFVDEDGKQALFQGLSAFLREQGVAFDARNEPAEQRMQPFG